jgi:glycosyltransferase involved in cell wall biosynthesis
LCVEPESPEALGDAILHYYRNESARLEAGRSARRCAEAEFDPATLAEAYLDALRRAIQEEPGRGNMPTEDRFEYEKR